MKNIILDTDIGGDPDDSIALLYALNHPSLSVRSIITSDEYTGNMRARLVWHILKKLKVSIPVYSGIDLGNTTYFLFKSLSTPSSNIPTIQNSADELKTIFDQLSKSHGYYVSIGGMSNLARFITLFPDQFRSIHIYIMGGAIHYRKPNTAEHNVRLDVESARLVFNSGLDTKWLLSDHTFTPQTRIDLRSTFYRFIEGENENYLVTIIKENMKKFYESFYPCSYLHDPLLISSIVNPVVEYQPASLTVKQNGEFIVSKRGTKQNVSSNVNYDLFWSDFYSVLGRAKS